jgi:three-Cys-motif partner protein
MARLFAENLRPIMMRYAPVMQELLDVDKDQVFQGDFWAPLKLVCFASYTHSCYVKIIKNHVKDFYFVDLLSSSGITRVSKCKECDLEGTKACETCKYKDRRKAYMAGSALIASTADPPFKRMYFVDNDQDKLTVLGKRLTILERNGMCKSSHVLLKGDCNDLIDKILSEIRSDNYNFLIFVDNQGLDANWETINKLLDCHCDIIINFPTSSIARNINNNAVKTFLGCNDIGDLGYSEPIDYYLNKIRQKRTAEAIKINTGIGFHYHLILITKQNPRFKAFIDSLKETIEGNTAKEAEMAFDIIAGKQAVL